MDFKVVIFGASGMIGQAVLNECIKNDTVSKILLISRQKTNIANSKIEEIIHTDMFNLTPIATALSGFNVCYNCIGISSVGMDEKTFTRYTFDLTTHIAQTMLQNNPESYFTYISGQGTDSSEKGRVMWARVKGRTENALIKMPFKAVYIFRPGYIQPLNGIKSRTKLYNALYFFTKPLYFILKHFEKQITDTNRTAKSFINCIKYNESKNILEIEDINRLGILE
ncbi:MAG: NAD-dependent epimerase/dehydratase family protein [Bacteroidales bacterium]|nr:NAD-dependent epimerase/dehydratase family protein [Bacteroidales bacterium]